jgi:hypothetical protein
MEAPNATAHNVLEEMHLMEARLTEQIAGRCDGLEQRVEQQCDEIYQHFTHRCDTIHQQVDVAALHDEERILELELLKTDINIWKPDLTKNVDDLSLEMARVGKFLEREFCPTAYDQPGIFGPCAQLPVSTTPTGLSAAASNFTTGIVSLGHVALRLISRSRVRSLRTRLACLVSWLSNIIHFSCLGSYNVLQWVVYLNLLSLDSMVLNHNHGSQNVKNTLRCMRLSILCG